MTADSPASGLPQEAVDAAAASTDDVISPWVGRLRLVWHKAAGSPPLPAPDEEVLAELDARIERAARAALTAAWPFLREQWEANERVVIHGLQDALAAERAKVAGLREELDEAKARNIANVESLTRKCAQLIRERDALLPAVSEGAPTVGTDGQAEWRDEKCANCNGVARNCADVFPVLCCGKCTHPGGINVPAAVVRPTGTAGECGHAEHAGDYLGRRTGLIERRHGPSRWEPCPSQSAKGEQ